MLRRRLLRLWASCLLCICLLYRLNDQHEQVKPVCGVLPLKLLLCRICCKRRCCISHVYIPLLLQLEVLVCWGSCWLHLNCWRWQWLLLQLQALLMHSMQQLLRMGPGAAVL
jgi:hypothetical protein